MKSLGEPAAVKKEFRIEGLPYSTVQKQDDIRRETVKKLTTKSRVADGRFRQEPKIQPVQREDEGINAQRGESRSTSRCARSLPKYNAKIVY